MRDEGSKSSPHSIVSLELIPIVLVVQHSAIRVDGSVFSAAVAEDAGEERMNAQLIVVADGQLVGDRVFKITLDVDICLLAGNHPTERADLDQHPLKFEHTLPTEDSLAVARKYLVKVAH